jgi:hypothetical protein
MNDFQPLRVRAKLFLRSILPKKAFDSVTKVWVRTGAHFVGDQDTLTRYRADFLAHNPKVVQAGPFKGMQYVDKAIGSSYLHKLIGSYEAILHPYIKSIQGRGYDTILDVGSAEGYYLVGLGQLFPQADLIGFEIEQEGRDLSKEMYEKNHLSNKLLLKGEATVDAIAPLITRKTLLICDCEGGEMDILDPVARPELLAIESAIIELHDFIRPGIKEALTARFEATHTIAIIPFSMPNPNDFPYLASIKNKKDLYEIGRERGWQEQEWMILERKSS